MPRDNNSEYGEFDSYLEDEYGFDAHYPPGTEALGGDAAAISEEFNQGPLRLQRDNGSGSAAEDGRQEILEDRMSDSELGSYAMYGPTEVGADFEGQDSYLEHQYEIGAGAAADRPGSEIGNYAESGPSEVGSYAENGPSEIGVSGFIAQDGPSEIGQYAEDGASEVGQYSEDGPSEIGQFSEDGAAEIGAEYIQAPFESFMLEDARMGDDEDFEIGAQAAADRPGSEIVGEAVLRVIEKARDNRRPAPPMKAVPVEAPFEEDEWSLSDVTIGAAVASGADQFPMLNDFLLRAGAAVTPRIVRVDTEESYKAFRTERSPELSEFRDALEAHMSDPRAHGGGRREELDERDDLSDDIDELVHLGAEAGAAEDSKRIPLYTAKHFDGKIDAWQEGDDVCASFQLPSSDGKVRICTSIEPLKKCIEEISRHAAESGASIGAVVSSLPAMGCTLGAATVLKEMAAGAPAILNRPEADRPEPFVVRLEPKTNPNIAALAMLAFACRAGNEQACDEWQRLSAGSPNVVKQAMTEAKQLVLAAA